MSNVVIVREPANSVVVRPLARNISVAALIRSVSVLPGRPIVVVRPLDRHVSVASPGPPGPRGLTGPMGPTGGEHFVYNRGGIPAGTWTIQHNLGREVHITVISDSGEHVFADVTQNDLNSASVSFGAPFAGKAYIG